MFIVFASNKFIALGGGEVGRHFLGWRHFKTNPPEADASPETAEIAKKVVADAERFIQRTTGFSPQDIADTISSLEEQYKREKTSPVVIEWI